MIAATGLWLLPRGCDCCHGAAIAATGLRLLSRGCGCCHGAAVAATRLWLLPRGCDCCHGAVIAATGLRLLPRGCSCQTVIAAHEPGFTCNYISGFHRYPLILSIENHCSIEQQQQMIASLKTVLGNKIYAEPINGNSFSLPSPEELKYRILIKV